MGRKNWGDKLGTIFLVGINVLFICAGIAILIASILSWNELEDLRSRADLLKELNLDVIIQVVLFAAAAMFLVAILGFVAAVKKLKRLMVFYVVMIFVILTVQMAMGIVMLTMDSSDVYDTFREDSVEGYQRRENFQTYMECCGWDYSTEEFFPERVACVARHPTYTNTCKEEVQDVIDTWVTPTGIVLVVLSVLALIALVAALVVIFSQRKKKEDFFENPFSF